MGFHAPNTFCNLSNNFMSQVLIGGNPNPVGAKSMVSTSEKSVVYGACPHDCPDTCSMLVTVEDGRAVKVEGP